VLRHPACQKDAFVWSNFSSDKTKENECGCWPMPSSVNCYWGAPGDASRFKFYFQLLPRHELPEAGRDICWTDCAPYSRTSGNDPESMGACSSCISVLDLHLFHPSLAHMTPGDGVAQVPPPCLRFLKRICRALTDLVMLLASANRYDRNLPVGELRSELLKVPAQGRVGRPAWL